MAYADRATPSHEKHGYPYGGGIRSLGRGLRVSVYPAGTGGLKRSGGSFFRSILLAEATAFRPDTQLSALVSY